MTRGVRNSMVTVMRLVHVVPGECWDWQGGTDPDGYGECSIDGKRARVPRYMYEQVYGPIPVGQHVRHTCDRRICVNPSHLILGTTQQNTQDRQDRQRQARGAHHNKARMTEAQALAILASGLRPAEAAREHGVTFKQAYNLLAGNTWRHLKR